MWRWEWWWWWKWWRPWRLMTLTLRISVIQKQSFGNNNHLMGISNYNCGHKYLIVRENNGSTLFFAIALIVNSRKNILLRNVQTNTMWYENLWSIQNIHLQNWERRIFSEYSWKKFDDNKIKCEVNFFTKIFFSSFK